MEINRDSFTLAEQLRYCSSEHSDEKLLNRVINDTTEEMFRVADLGYTGLTIKMWSDLGRYLETIDKQWDKFSKHFEEQGITVTKEYTQVSIQGMQGSAKYLETVNLSWGEN